MITSKRLFLMSAVSVADLLTANFLQFGTPLAKGLIIPVYGDVASTTLSFYFRNDEQYNQNGYSTLLDARDALQGCLLATFDSGPIAGASNRFFTNGIDVSNYNVNVIIANSAQTSWVRFDIVFENIARREGFLYFFMNNDGSNNYQPWKIADLRVYDYALSRAQMGAPTLPPDYSTRYNFFGYQPGDRTLTDISGNGNHAVVYY